VTRPKIARKSASGFSSTFWVTAQTSFTQLFGLALFAVQAPLLGPRAFGLISIVMVFTGFCETVLIEAATDALISITAIEDLHFATMTTINVGFAAVLSAAILLLSAPIASLFKDAELTAVLRCMAVLPLLSALASAPNAYTKRALEFRPLAVRAIVGIATGGAVGLTLALLGWGVWALVWQAIVQRLTSVATLWWAVPLELRFGISRRHANDLRVFLGPLCLSRTMKWGSGQIPRFLLGLYLGASELGLFSLASRLNDILTQVTVVSKYAVMRLEFRQFLNNPSGLEASLQRSLRQMSFMYFPLFVGAAAVMPALFHAWLDARWVGGIVPAQLLMLMGLPGVSLFAIGGLLMALNFQRSEAMLSVADTLATVVLVAVSAPHGLLLAATAYACRPLATLPLGTHYARADCGIAARSMLSPQLPALVAALAMGALVWTLGDYLQGKSSAPIVLLVQIVAGVVSYALITLMLAPMAAAQAAKPFWERLRRLAGKRA